MAKSMHGTPFETVRVGVVSSVDLKKGTARVFFEDRDDAVSPELPVMQKNTMIRTQKAKRPSNHTTN